MMNFSPDLSGMYELAGSLWPRLPYYIKSAEMLFKPIVYLFNITHQCNVSCPHCCQKKNMGLNKPELSLEEILAIIKKLPWYAVIALSGGEPLCRKDFLEIVKGIKRQKKKSALLTNGLLLTDSIICGIIENQLLNIGITIDGNKEYYEQIKGRGNYATLMDKMDRLVYYKKKLRSLFPALDVKVTVFPENVKQLPFLYQQAVDYDADTFTVSLPKKNDFQFSDSLHGLEIIDLIFPSSVSGGFADDVCGQYKTLFSLSRNVKTKLRTYPYLKRAEDIENYFNTSVIQKRYAKCREPWIGMVISAAGEVYPCLSVKLGNLKKQSLDQVLMSPENIQFREQLKKKGIFSICDGCCYAKIKAVQNKERIILRA